MVLLLPRLELLHDIEEIVIHILLMLETALYLEAPQMRARQEARGEAEYLVEVSEGCILEILICTNLFRLLAILFRLLAIHSWLFRLLIIHFWMLTVHFRLLTILFQLLTIGVIVS